MKPKADAVFLEVYDAYYGSVLGYVGLHATRIADVQDIVQNIFIAFYEIIRKKGNERIDEPEAYLITIAKHELQKAAKKQFMTVQMDDSKEFGSEWENIPDPKAEHELLIQRMSVEQLFACIETFDVLSQKILFGHYRMGYTLKELSEQFSTNVFNYVVAVTPLNEDAAVMTADVDLKFKSLPAALNNLMDEAIKTGYITQVDTDNAVLLTVYGEDGIQRTEKQEELKTTVEEHLKAAEIVGEVISNGITEQDKTDAVTYGVSNGKVMFVRNIVTVYPTLVFENLIHESVKNIMRQVNDIRSATRAENTELRTTYQEAKKTLIEATKVKMDAFKSDIQTEVDSRGTEGMTKEQIAEVRKQVIEEKNTEIKAVIQDRNETLKDDEATYFEKLKENRINNRK